MHRYAPGNSQHIRRTPPLRENTSGGLILHVKRILKVLYYEKYIYKTQMQQIFYSVGFFRTQPSRAFERRSLNRAKDNRKILLLQQVTRVKPIRRSNLKFQLMINKLSQ